MIIALARDEGLKHRIAACLKDTRWSGAVTDVDSVGEAQALLRRAGGARVIVVGESIGQSGAAEIAAMADSLRQAPAVFVIAEPSTQALRAAMRAGIRDVLPPDFGPDELILAFEEAGVGSGGPPALPGLTVAVFSTKGGVGTSVVASNLAVRLGELAGVPTTLVDLDLASADQAIMHGLSPRWTIQDLADGAVGMDVESLGQVLLPIPGTDARILPGPVDPALAETITSAHVTAVVAAARAEARVVVLDTASSFDDRTLAVLDLADVIVVTSSLDVAALRSLAVSLQTLERLGVEPGRIRIVLVRSDSKSGLLPGDVERAIERSIDVGIPSTRAVPRSVNEGIPLAVASPKTSVVRAIDDLGRLVLAAAPEQLGTDHDEAGGGFFPWSRNRSTTPPDGADEGDDPSPTPQVVVTVDDEAPEPEPRVDASGEEPARDSTEFGVDGADILPMERIRPGSSPTARRRVVRSRHAEPDDGEGGDDEDVPDAAAPLSELPPPTVIAHDDDDDQPRRRRRR